MATAAVTYTFTGGTAAVAAQVNQDFTDLVNFLNTSVVHVDGSKSMTGILALPASDPSTDNQATRKLYVNTQDKGRYGYLNGTYNDAAGGGAVNPVTLPTQMYIAAESVAVATNSSGNAAVTFPNAFPNHITTVICSSGDVNGNITVLYTTSYSTTGFQFHCSTPSTTVRLNYAAFGW